MTASATQLRDALKAIALDAEAMYNNLACGQIPIVSIGAWRRLRRAQELIAASALHPVPEGALPTGVARDPILPPAIFTYECRIIHNPVTRTRVQAVSAFEARRALAAQYKVHVCDVIAIRIREGS